MNEQAYLRVVPLPLQCSSMQNYNTGANPTGNTEVIGQITNNVEGLSFLDNFRQTPAEIELVPSTSEDFVFIGVQPQLMGQTERPSYKVRKTRAKNARRAAKKALIESWEQKCARQMSEIDADIRARVKREQRAATRAKVAAKAAAKQARYTAQLARHCERVEREFLALHLPFWGERRLPNMESLEQQFARVARRTRFYAGARVFNLPLNNRFSVFATLPTFRRYPDHSGDYIDRPALESDLHRHPLNAQRDPTFYRVDESGVVYCVAPCSAFTWDEAIQIIARATDDAVIEHFLGGQDVRRDAVAGLLPAWWGPDGRYLYPAGDKSQRRDFEHLLSGRFTPEQRRYHRNMRALRASALHNSADDWFLEQAYQDALSFRESGMALTDFEDQSQQCRAVRRRKRCRSNVHCARCNRCVTHCFRGGCLSWVARQRADHQAKMEGFFARRERYGGRNRTVPTANSRPSSPRWDPYAEEYLSRTELEHQSLWDVREAREQLEAFRNRFPAAYEVIQEAEGRVDAEWPREGFVVPEDCGIPAEFEGDWLPSDDELEHEGEIQALFPTNVNITHTLDNELLMSVIRPCIEAVAPAAVSKFERMVADFIHLAVLVVTSGGNWATVVASLSWFVSLHASEFSITKIVESVKDWWKPILAGPVQADSDDVPALQWLAPIGALALTILGVITVHKLPGKGDVNEFFQRFSKVKGMFGSFQELLTQGAALGDFFADYYRKWFLGYSVQDLNGWKSIDEWCGEVARLNTSHLESDLQTDESLKAKLDSLIMRGDEHIKTLDRLSVPLAQRARVQNCWLFLRDARILAMSYDPGLTAPRAAPAVVHIYGDTGTGKSTSLPFLQAHVLAALGCTDPRDCGDKVYYRYPGSEFWDGFKNGTQIVVCDDFGSLKDSPMKPNPEALEAIRMSNTAFWALPMAHLANKGTTAFKPKLVVWTSNRPTFVFDSLTNPEAVQRRVDLKLRQRPHPDYSVKRSIDGKEYTVLDQGKVAVEALTDPTVYTRCFVFDIMECNYRAEVLLQADVPYDVIAQQITNLTLNKHKSGEAVNSAARAYFERLARGGQAQADDDDLELGPYPREEERPLSLEEDHPALLRVMPPRLVARDIVPEERFVQRVSDCPRPTPFYVRRTWKDLIMSSNVHVDVRSTVAGRGSMEIDPALAVQNPGSPFRWASIARARCIVTRYEHLTPKLTAVLRLARSEFVSAHPQQRELVFCCIFNKYFGDLEITDFLGCDHSHEHRTCDPPMWEEYVAVVGRSVAWFEKAWQVLKRAFLDMLDKIIQNPMLSACAVASGVMALSGVTLPLASWLMSSKVQKPQAKAARVESSADRVMATPIIKVESASERTQAAPTVKVESASEKTMATTTVKVESAAQKTTSAQVVRVESGERAILLDDDNIEATTDQNSLELAKILARNVYVLERNVDGEWRHTLNAVVVAGRIMLLNRHVMLFDNCREWRIRNVFLQGGYHFNLFDCPMVFPDDEGPHSKKDSMLIELPRTVHLHRTVLPYFMTTEDLSRHRTLLAGAYQGASLLRFKKNMDIPTLLYSTSNVVVSMDSEFILKRGEEEVGRVRDFYYHMIPTVKGDCGSVFMAIDKNFERKIIGIHAAGAPAPYTGIVTPTSAEFITHLLSKLEVRHPESLIGTNLQADEEIRMEAADDGTLSFPDSFTGFSPIGEMAQGVFAPRRSAIQPSPVHGLIREPITKPAYLHPVMVDGKLVDPEEVGRSKAAGVCQPIDMPTLRAAVNSVRQMVCRNVQGSDRTILTFEEAIRGREGDDFIQPVNRRSSPGYGWKKVGKGKTHYLGSDEYNLEHPDVVREYRKMLATAMRGERPCVIWQDTLKDERRPIAKVNQGKTRLFAAGEMIFTILFRQYFAGFCAHLARNRIDMESCVGVNPYSKDWDFLARKIQQVGPHVIAGDFTNYDGTLHPQILWELLDGVIEPFYEGSTQDRVIRRALWCEIVNSIHITGKKVYMWTHSQPSGCPATAIINSVYHSISARIVWVICARKYKPEMVSMKRFAEKIRHVNYGDDDVWNIHPSVVDWFNQITISEAYREIGMTYTDEAKTGTIVATRPLSDVNFLKRGFRWDKSAARYRAPLALETIYEMAMWTKGTVDQYSVVAATLDMAAYEAAQHSEAEFEEILSHLEVARRIVNERVPCSFLTYSEYQDQEWRKYVAGVI